MTPLAIIGTINGVTSAVSDVCKVLISPEGQLLMEQWRKNADRFNGAMESIGAWLTKTAAIAFDLSADETGKLKATVKATGGK